MLVPTSVPFEPSVSGFVSHVIPQLFNVADLFTIELDVFEGHVIRL